MTQPHEIDQTILKEGMKALDEAPPTSWVFRLKQLLQDEVTG